MILSGRLRPGGLRGRQAAVRPHRWRLRTKPGIAAEARSGCPRAFGHRRRWRWPVDRRHSTAIVGKPAIALRATEARRIRGPGTRSVPPWT